MRVMDCKLQGCQDALDGHPLILDYLDNESYEHYERLKQILTTIQLPFEENPKLVRGLDYYTHTVFEVISHNLGAQSAILGGGRYNGLVQQLGGPAVPAFGWSIGLDRLIMLLQQCKCDIKQDTPTVLIPLGYNATLKALTLARNWWKHNLSIQLDTRGCNLKKSLTTANRLGCKIALILGDNELTHNIITVKHLDTGVQEIWNVDDVITNLCHLKSI
jgi:histidyl-tRNA synthetase